MRDFLNVFDDRRMHIVSILIREAREMSIPELIKMTNYSENTVRTIVKELHTHPELNSNRLFFTSNKTGQILTIKILNAEVETVGLFYLKRSILFNFVMDSFLLGKVNVGQFCDTHYISKSTFLRYKKRFIDFIEKHGLSLSENNEIMGNEYRIRTFYFLFFSSASSLWLFSEDLDILEQSLTSNFFSKFQLNPTQKHHFLLMIFICKIREQHSCFIESPYRVTFSKNGLYKELSDSLSLSVTSFTEKEEQAESEAAFLFLFILKNKLLPSLSNTIQETLVFDTKINNLNTAIKAITQMFYTNLFHDEFDHTSEINQIEDFDLLHQEVSLFLLYEYYCSYDPRDFLYVYTEDYYHLNPYKQLIKNKSDHILEQIDQLSATYPFLAEYLKPDKIEHFKNQFFLFTIHLYPLFKQGRIDPVTINIQNGNAYIKEIITMKLLLLFRENITIADHFDKAIDLLISDKSYSGEFPHKNKIYLPTFTDEKYLRNVCQAIQEEIFNRSSYLSFE
ncbi:helix-turn-helix domain-containing protein [Candidatus Enterococcus mansonii]|uniref:Mga helix-turn-helix domain-containing protein n=1 Tax=Candidatus Enterococcus mansonii TaxID=1834181 RepID=A0A242CG54_9ENTE|nr:helix-turn-helix domain-containing protein [Enterococcus sp. 4G2_DIV0659]OTO08762.1 hypothetical protein A5880_001762 [Enterococcus sp. 4G2_DIV0659]